MPPHTIKVIADKLSSLFCGPLEGVLRVRHLSIIDFFVNPSTEGNFRVNLDTTNAELGIYCLKTMSKELRFNICRLETSYLTNSEIMDLESRIRQHISDALQYNCLYFSGHLTSDGDPSADTKRQLENVLGCEKALFWMEVISLLRKAPTAIASLRKLRIWLQVI